MRSSICVLKGPELLADPADEPGLLPKLAEGRDVRVLIRLYPTSRQLTGATATRREGGLAPDAAENGCQTSFSVTASVASRRIRRPAGPDLVTTGYSCLTQPDQRIQT